MEKEEYKISGLTYYQTELTWKKDKQLIKLYNAVRKAASKTEELILSDLQPLLAKHNLLNKFFGIILRPKFTFRFVFSTRIFKYYIGGVINIDHATNTQIGKIFGDFFLLNKTYATKLNELMKALGLIATEAQKETKTKQ